MSRFEVYKDGVQEFRWRLVADNSEIVAVGESHKGPHDAARAAQGVARQVAEAVGFDEALQAQAEHVPIAVVRP